MQPHDSPYQFERLDNYTLLTLHPLINDGQWGNVSQVGTEILNRLSAMQKPALVVDLTPLDYMGSAQVALLVRIWKALKESGGKMSVQCPGETAKNVLTTAGLSSVWKIVDDRSAALAAIGCRGSNGGSTVGSSEAGEMTSSPLLAIVAIVAAVCALGVGAVGSGSMGTMASVGLQVILALAGIAAGGLGFVRILGLW
ncbi:MAG: STAS domain-containing protein, partial [Planctomycetes bacterium]|nr:STAS domain-containing protein [Planctomycetota bacterium]